MGNRLSRIVTRTGDDGTTGLGDATRVPKDAPRIEAIGAIDELNSYIGLLIALSAGVRQPVTPSPAEWLLDVQHDLFDLGAELSIPGLVRIPAERVEALEQLVETLNASLPPLQEFILPGGSTAAATCHLARTVCRRAERRCWALMHSDAGGATAAMNAASLHFLNRLSDLLFVLARLLARADGGSEILWRHRRPEGSGR
jgi:cob(I)alamin adenosyltransferase